MSIQLIEQRLDALLTGSEPSVVLLTGDWGTGKTHHWRQAMARNQNEQEKRLYISLFGLSSLTEVRKRIAEEAIGSHAIPGVGKVSELITSGGWKLNPLHVWKVVQAFPFAARLDGLAQDLSFAALRNAVICIDDLERASGGLKIADVLGLANHLKEERSCRVLLVSNRARLSAEDSQVLIRYQEKVIDEQLELAPTVDEALQIAYGGSIDAGTVLLRRRAAQLQISNIRVLRQLQKLARPIHDLLQAFHPLVREEAIQAVALFGACHLMDSDRLPTTDFLFSLTDSWSRYLRREVKKDELSEEQRQQARWDEMLHEYGYQLTSSLDAEIGESVKRGFIDSAALVRVGAALSEEKTGADVIGELNDAITAFWHAINDDSNAALQRVFTAAMQAAQVSDLSVASGAWHILSESGQDARARELLDHFIEINQARPAVFEAVNGHFSDKYSGEFADRIKAQAALHRVVPTFEEALDRIRPDRGWDSADVERVCTGDEVDIERALRSATPRNFRSRIRVLLGLPGLNGATAAAHQVVDATQKTLQRWIAEDPIKAIRLQQYLPTSSASPASSTSPQA